MYGIIGSAILATQALDDQVVSNHVIRLAPKKDSVPAGYILTALTHPTLGRPLVKALAFGLSIPEIDTSDLAGLQIVRLKTADEMAIAELAEASAAARAEADVLEREIATDAAGIIDRFIRFGERRGVVAEPRAESYPGHSELEIRVAEQSPMFRSNDADES